MNKKNKRPLSPQDSRAIRRSIIRPLTVKPSRAFFAKQTPFSHKVVKRQMLNRRVTQNLSQRVSLNNWLRVVPGVHTVREISRCASKVLSWRADQKSSGKGGRQRVPRSQREKAASAAKLSKLCK